MRRMKNSIPNKLSVAIVGLGLAGNTHLYECLMNPNVSVIAVCDPKVEASSQELANYDITHIYKDVKNICKSCLEKIDIFVISVPPGQVKTVLEFIDGRHLSIVDKPGDFDLSREQNYYYYSRRGMVEYEKFLSILEVSKKTKFLEYTVCGDFATRYSARRGQLEDWRSGVIEDSLCHFFELYFRVFSDNLRFDIKSKTNFLEFTIECELSALKSDGINILINIRNESEPENETWTLSNGKELIKYFNGSLYDSIIDNTKITQVKYNFADELVKLYHGMETIFLNSEQNNQILGQIKMINEKLNKAELR